ncbi:MAG TPA: hypothetical protein VHG51_21310 [Longimicrobiaceae bacterium]|nr:hypothetical protein [Longimicrobiaceae bacterium]
MIPIYDAGPQATRVRALLWFSLLCAAAALWAGADLAWTYGLSPGDGGVLAPLPVRLAWGVGIAAVGVGFAVGMWVYRACYVAGAAVDEAGGALHLRLVGYFGRPVRVLPVERVLGSRYHPGQASYGGVAVNAPWDTVWVEGRRLPLIVDARGDVLDRERARRYLGI